MYNTSLEVKSFLFYVLQKIWSLYDESCGMSRITPVAYTTFTDLWNKLLPHIKVGKPIADLCWVCQQNSTLITRSMNKSEDEKSEVHVVVAEDFNVNFSRSTINSIFIRVLTKNQENICCLVLLKCTCTNIHEYNNYLLGYQAC